MTRKDRTVANRQKSLEPGLPESGFMTGGMKALYARAGGKEIHCTISGHCRTQIFEFPGIAFHPNGDEPHHPIYSSPTIRAYVASSLVDYFENSARSRHYAISPSLRYKVGELEEKVRSQQKSSVLAFIVIEESNQLAPVKMTKGECNILPERFVKDGEEVPLLTGGRAGEEFILAWANSDGAWPEVPNNQQSVNMILAGVRAGQQTPEPIHKRLDQECLVTDDGRFVVMQRPTMSARASTVTPMDTTAYRGRIAEIRRGIAALKQDIGAPHMALLVNSMYSEEYKDDAYQRLQYLQLWQSLSEAARPFLGYSGNVREDNVALAGNKTLKELKDYRDDIAHWWTDTIDENYLSDLRLTVNELIRSKYF